MFTEVSVKLLVKIGNKFLTKNCGSVGSTFFLMKYQYWQYFLKFFLKSLPSEHEMHNEIRTDQNRLIMRTIQQ